MKILDDIIKLGRQLLPTGRAFKMPFGGDMEKLNRALATSEAQWLNDAKSVLNSALPDNDSFTANDATLWERRLGLITNIATPLADRKLAIIRKMQHPGSIKARQHYLYIQGQLQAAGFNLYVYENKFPAYPTGWTTKTPGQFVLIPPLGTPQVQHSIFIEHGDVQHGDGVVLEIVANYIEQSYDASFNVSPNFRSTFFIGGPYPGEYANILSSRHNELRQLILKLKPAQEIAYLLIQYI